MSNEMSHQQQQIDNGDSPDFAVEVEVDIVDEVRDEQHRQHQIESPQQQRVVIVSNSTSNRTSAGGIVSAAAEQLSSSDGAPGRRTGASRGRAAASQYTIQQLIRFDPMQCFDIDELRNRMVEAQRRIADSASMHLNYNKFKNDNAQLREELASCDHRIALLEATVAERNERLKELLKENIFMRAQYKKIQNEFGVDAVKEVFNRLAR